MPQEIHIRPATEPDTAAMARVNVDTRRAAYRDFYPAHLLAAMSYERIEKAWRQILWEGPQAGEKIVLVAETEAGEVIGILIAGKEQNQDVEYQGEIYVLYVLPEYHRLGIGRRLVSAAVENLLAVGISSLLIWVLADNPACRFYESLGGKPVREKELEVGEGTMKEIGYGWKDIGNLVG